MVDRIEEFHKRVRRDPELLGKLMVGVAGPRDFLRNVVAEGRRIGFDFTYEDAHAFMKLHEAAVVDAGDVQ
jgi:hypothetical protein